MPVPDGATVIEQGPFGSVQWFLMLAERIKPAVALRAVDGWGGDSHAVWVSGGKTCVAARFSGDTPEDDDEMYGALKRWTKAMPDGTAADRPGERQRLVRELRPRDRRRTSR